MTYFCVTPSISTSGSRHSPVGTTSKTQLLLWSLKCFLSLQTSGAKHRGHLLTELFLNLEFIHISLQTSYVYTAIFKLYAHKTLGKNTNWMDSKPNWLKYTYLKRNIEMAWTHFLALFNVCHVRIVAFQGRAGSSKVDLIFASNWKSFPLWPSKISLRIGYMYKNK